MKLIVSDTERETLVSLTEEVMRVMHEISVRDISLALSGGSTPVALFDLWAADYADRIEWGRIQFFFADERCVPPTDNESNYHMTMEHLLSKVPAEARKIHRIRGEADPEDESMRYGGLVGKLLPWRNQIPVFDIILLGIGNDGHTASLFTIPDLRLEYSRSADFETGNGFSYIRIDNINEKRCYVATVRPQDGIKRVSMGISLINNARNVFFLVLGPEKYEVLANIINKTDHSSSYPAAYVAPSEGALIMFTDKIAFLRICKFDN